MGVATGIAFDSKENLYVGDRSGTIFKIRPERQIYVFATLEASISAYHLCFGPEDMLFVTGPDDVELRRGAADHAGGVKWTVFYAGWDGRREWTSTKRATCTWPDRLGGRRGIVRIAPGGARASLVLSGPNIVGLAFTPGAKYGGGDDQFGRFRVAAGIEGLKRV